MNDFDFQRLYKKKKKVKMLNFPKVAKVSNKIILRISYKLESQSKTTFLLQVQL